MKLVFVEHLRNFLSGATTYVSQHHKTQYVQLPDSLQCRSCIKTVDDNVTAAKITL